MSEDDFTPLRITHRAHGRDISLRIRAWAKAQGYSVSERGRLAPKITEAFFAAHPEVYEQAEKYERVRATARTPGASPEDYAWERGSNLGEIELLRRPILGAAIPGAYF